MNENRIARASHRLRRPLTVAAMLTAAALTLTACSAGDDTSSAGGASGTLTLVAATPPTSIDPALANADAVGGWYTQLAYDPLIRLDKDGELEPGLAKSWKFLDDQSKEFQLTLRAGVQFSDGTKMTAKAVADSLNYFVSDGVNGAAWLGGEDTVAEATGDDTVVMHLGESDSTLPNFLTQRSITGSVIAPAGLKDPAALKGKTLGAGPYVLDADQTVSQSSYVYVPNEHYWNKADIHYGKVVIQVSGSNSASYQSIAAGSADVMRGDLATAKSAKAAGLNVIAEPGSIIGVSYADRSGTVVPELADVRVRQALSYAIDRKAITNAAWGSDGIVGNGLALPDNPGYSEDVSDSYGYDLDKAKELLDEAGYADGFSFEIGAPNTPPADAVTQAVVEGWKAIGVDAKISSYSDSGQLSTDALAKKFGVLIYYYGAGQTSGVMDDFLSGAATQYNPFGTSDPTIEKALATAKTSPDADAQADAYVTAMQTGIVDEAWLSNIAYAPAFVITSKKVTGTGYTSALGSPDVAQEVKPSKG